MTVYRTKDLADAVRISVQQVRNYEADGFIPAANRSPNGYRRYTEQHLTALKVAKQLMAGYGLQRTQQIMQAIHQGKRSRALALIDERHAELAAMRLQNEQTFSALNTLALQLPVNEAVRIPEHLYVSAAARLVGVRVSALRFWEQQGLLHPTREKSSRYRLYDQRQLHRLRIVVLLRQANYDFATIRTTLNELETRQFQRALAAVESRQNELDRISWSCLQAIAALHCYITEFME
jgi:DNA-binding transcriptional MerR regulator